MCRGLRDRGVADVADLAMLFIGRVPMPVPGRFHGEDAHGEDQGDGQQSYGYALGHCRF